MEEGNGGPVIDTHCAAMPLETESRGGRGARTLQVLRTLPLLAGLADDFDRPTGKDSDDSLSLVLPSRADDLDKCFHLFLLLVHIGDEQLFPNTTAYVRGAGRRIGNIKGFAGSCRPLDIALLASSLARDRHNDPWWGEFRFVTATRDVRPPRITNQNGGWRGA